MEAPPSRLPASPGTRGGSGKASTTCSALRGRQTAVSVFRDVMAASAAAAGVTVAFVLTVRLWFRRGKSLREP